MNEHPHDDCVWYLRRTVIAFRKHFWRFAPRRNGPPCTTTNNYPRLEKKLEETKEIELRPQGNNFINYVHVFQSNRMFFVQKALQSQQRHDLLQLLSLVLLWTDNQPAINHHTYWDGSALHALQWSVFMNSLCHCCSQCPWPPNCTSEVFMSRVIPKEMNLFGEAFCSVSAIRTLFLDLVSHQPHAQQPE